MNSNIYRYSIIGETLRNTLDELKDNYRINDDLLDKVLEKFDQIANKNICHDINSREKEKYDLTPAHITGIEHEFKFHEGIWSLKLKDVNVRNEWMEMNTSALKVIAVTLDNNMKRKKRTVARRIKKEL